MMMRSKITTSAIRTTLILLASAILAIGLAVAQSTPASSPSQQNPPSKSATAPSQSSANGVNAAPDNNGAAANPSQSPAANPNTPENTDQNGNPIPAHRTDSRSWLWILLGVIVIALVARYINRGRARPGTGPSNNRSGRNDPNDIRRAG
jgi:hypothetical protein